MRRDGKLIREMRGRASGLVSDDDGVSARDLLEATPEALVVCDSAFNIVQMDEAAAKAFGFRRDELLQRPFDTLISERYRSAHARQRAEIFREPARRPGTASPELRGVRKDGTEFPLEIVLSTLDSARGRLLLASIRDISERRKAETDNSYLVRERELYAEIARLAQQDALTGLPNRALFYDRLGSAIATARRQGHKLAVLSLDLDRFKHVNDSLGHGTGDRLLESVVHRLTASVRDVDTVSRQGGDEFVILLSEMRDREEIVLAASKVLAAVTGTHRIGNHELHVTASVGIAMYPDAGRDPDSLIKNADIAMYHAKESGRDNFQFFRDVMNERVVERHVLEASLRGALDRREFVLYYQPKVDLDTGAIIGAEALIRWRHPERGLIPPERFVPIAEDSRLIVPIGQWVLGEACRQAREWRAAGLEPLPVAVNISAIEFRSDGFLQGVDRILRDSGLEPRLLELELTESVLMESASATASVLHDLKEIGLRLAVDDFGTGYSSLSYLMQFPIDALKVDQSFVREITSETEGSAIIKAVISMGKSLKHRVIAEGVETPAQLAFLQAERCEEGQGFHFSRPLTAGQFAALLTNAGRSRS